MIPTLADWDGAATAQGSVTADTLNYRSLPNLQAPILGTWPRNTVLTIYCRVEKWLLVQAHATGWSHSAYIQVA